MVTQKIHIHRNIAFDICETVRGRIGNCFSFYVKESDYNGHENDEEFDFYFDGAYYWDVARVLMELEIIPMADNFQASKAWGKPMLVTNGTLIPAEKVSILFDDDLMEAFPVK